MASARIRAVLLILITGLLLIGFAYLLTRRQPPRNDSNSVGTIEEYLAAYIQSVSLVSQTGDVAVQFERVDYSSALFPNENVPKWYPLAGAIRVYWKIDEKMSIMVDTCNSDATVLEVNVCLWDRGELYGGILPVKKSDMALFVGNDALLPTILDRGGGFKAIYAPRDIIDKDKLSEVLAQKQAISTRKELASANKALSVLDREGYILLPKGIFPQLSGQFRINIVLGVRLRQLVPPPLGDDRG